LRNYVPYGVAENNEPSIEAQVWHNPHAVHRERAKTVVIAKCSRLLQFTAVCLKRANDRDRGVLQIRENGSRAETVVVHARSREYIRVLSSVKTDECSVYAEKI